MGEVIMNKKSLYTCIIIKFGLLLSVTALAAQQAGYDLQARNDNATNEVIYYRYSTFDVDQSNRLHI